MREILFRGKRMDTGEWVEGHYNYANWYLPPSMKIVDTTHHILPVGHGDSYEIDINTLGQYTGLTDKNGKKIFEGDVCRVTRPCVLAYGKITFENGCYWFVDDGPGGMLRLCDAKMNGFQIEVIGNIHDNPEMLGGGNDG